MRSLVPLFILLCVSATLAAAAPSLDGASAPEWKA